MKTFAAPYHALPIMALPTLFVAVAAIVFWMGKDTTPSAQAQQPPAPRKDSAKAPARNSSPSAMAYPASVEREAVAKIRAMLDRKISLEFVDTPLSEVIKVLSDKLGVPIRIDRRSFDDAAIPVDSPVTTRLKGISGRSALYWMLRDLGVVYQVAESGVVITTAEALEASYSPVAYPVADIAKQAVGAPDYASLIKLCTSLVDPSGWVDVGGPATISGPVRGCLVVRQSLTAHRRISQLFAALRNPDVKSLDSFGLDAFGSEQKQESQHLEKALRKTVKLQAKGPLVDVLKQLEDLSDAPIVLDRPALEDQVISIDTNVSIQLEDASVERCLREVLEPLGLTFQLHHEVISVTTAVASLSDLPVRFYPLRDLLESSVEFETQSDAVHYYGERLEEIAEVISSSVDVDSWDEVGGPATIVANLPRLQLVISQTRQGHRAIEGLLSGLREASKSTYAEKDAGRAPRLLPMHVQVYNSHGLDPTALVEAIKSHTGPDAWAQRSGASAAEAPYILVVRDESQTEGKNAKPSHRIVARHNARVHRQIHELLMKLNWGASPIAVVGGLF